MSKYIVIKDLKVSKANAHSSAYIVGPPSITAFHGFVQALLLTLANEGKNLNDAENLIIHDGFSIVHKDIQMLGQMRKIKYENVFFPEQLSSSHAYDKDDYAKGGNRLAMQPEAKCNLQVDIIIKAPDNLDITVKAVSDFLYSARIAGGTIDNSNGFSVFLEASEEKVFEKIKSGHFIVDRSDLLKAVDGKDSLELMLEMTRYYPKKKREHWLVPNTVGYLCLTDFQESELNRNGNDVAFAEPLITLTEYVSTRKRETIPFWNWIEEKVSSKDLFILKGENYEQN